MTLTPTERAAAVQQQVLRREPASPPSPPATVRRFTVWGPSNLSPRYSSILDILVEVQRLVVGSGWTEVEFLMKAGEGGTWQGAFDSHPLAPRGPNDLIDYVQVARDFGMRVSPYVVVRGRREWLAAEQVMIEKCCAIAGRCNLNVEPGTPYWNGPNDPDFIRDYLRGSGPRDALEVTLIPRLSQVNELGGRACIAAWTDPTLVGSASWECYGVSAPISGPTSLLVDEAIPRLDGWGVPADLHYRIPICQRSERARWAETIWAAGGLQIWFLDSD